MEKLIISIGLMLVATFFNEITALTINFLNKGESVVQFKTSKVGQVISLILRILIFLVGFIGTIYYAHLLKLLLI